MQWSLQHQLYWEILSHKPQGTKYCEGTLSRPLRSDDFMCDPCCMKLTWSLRRRPSTLQRKHAFACNHFYTWLPNKTRLKTSITHPTSTTIWMILGDSHNLLLPLYLLIAYIRRTLGHFQGTILPKCILHLEQPLIWAPKWVFRVPTSGPFILCCSYRRHLKDQQLNWISLTGIVEKEIITYKYNLEYMILCQNIKWKKS